MKLNLEQAIIEIENDLSGSAYANGNAKAFWLVCKAARITLNEHGPQFITDEYEDMSDCKV